MHENALASAPLLSPSAWWLQLKKISSITDPKYGKMLRKADSVCSQIAAFYCSKKPFGLIINSETSDIHVVPHSYDLGLDQIAEWWVLLGISIFKKVESRHPFTHNKAWILETKCGNWFFCPS